MANLGRADNLAGMIVTGLCSTFGLFLIRRFMESIPHDLIDAGQRWGRRGWICSPVVLPLAKAALAVLKA